MDLPGYDNWKLATPPEYEEDCSMGDEPWEDEGVEVHPRPVTPVVIVEPLPFPEDEVDMGEDIPF